MKRISCELHLAASEAPCVGAQDDKHELAPCWSHQDLGRQGTRWRSRRSKPVATGGGQPAPTISGGCALQINSLIDLFQLSYMATHDMLYMHM